MIMLSKFMKISRINYSSIHKNLNFFGGKNWYSSRSNNTISFDSMKDSKRFVRSNIDSVQIPDVNLAEFIWRDSVYNFSTSPALVDHDTAENYTFEQAWHLVQRFGSIMFKLGIGKGDKISTVMPNCMAYPLIASGTFGIGATLTCHNPYLNSDEIGRQLYLCQSRVIVTHSLYLDKLERAIKRASLGRHYVIVIDNNMKHHRYIKYEAMILGDLGREYPYERHGVDYKDDIALIMFVADGATGEYKGVKLSHRNIIANTVQILNPSNFNGFQKSTRDFQSTNLCVLPMYESLGMLVNFICTIKSGGRLILMPKFVEESYCKNVLAYQPSMLMAPPMIIERLIDNHLISEKQCQSIRQIWIPSGPATSQIYEKVHSKGPHIEIRECWDSAETGLALCSEDNSYKPGSCGVLMSNTDAKIVDSVTGEALGPNEIGDLYIRGPQCMVGYLFDSYTTREILDNDGFIETGFRGYFNEDFLMHLSERNNGTIKVDSIDVSVDELERTLSKHQSIQEVAVIGVPCPKYGQVPKAFVVLKKRSEGDINDDLMIANDIHGFMEENHPCFYKQLRGGIQFLPELPVNNLGKILRNFLKKLNNSISASSSSYSFNNI